MRGWLMLAVGVPLLSLIHPVVRAGVAPRMSGFEPVAANVWVEGAAGTTLPDLDLAEARVAEFWGAAPERPRILVCTTAACDARLALQSVRGMAYGDLLVVITSRAADDRVTYLAHELSHVALVRRVGRFAALRGEVPAWLNEGLAVLAAVTPGFRVDCDGDLPGDLPVSARDWRHGNLAEGSYTAAACAAEEWLEENTLDDL